MPTAFAVGISACRKSLVFDVLLLYHSVLTMIMATGSSVCRTALLGFAIRMGTLVNMKEEDNQRDQDKGLDSPSPCPLGFLPNQLFLLSDVRSGSIAKAMLSLASLFPYSHTHPVGVWAELVKLPEHCISCQISDA